MLRLMLPLVALMSACDDGEGVRFRVVNVSATRLYLQVPDVFWHLSDAGGRVRLQVRDSCEICNCSDRDCAVCGAASGMVAALDPRDRHEWEWDGRIWEQTGELNGQACERPEQQPPGLLSVDVTYAEQVRTTISGTWIEPPTAVSSVLFRYPGEGRVDIMLR
jgi:hypothetical protein